MHCLFCFVMDTRVIGFRLVREGSSAYRRRQYLICNERFTTFGVAELVIFRVVRGNDVRELLSENRLRGEMLKALRKRPVSADDVEMTANHIRTRLCGTGEHEVAGEMIGNLVMEQLRKLDRVAYIRLASVCRSLEDTREFDEEIARLRN